jgi:hypothetical protein
VILPARQRAGAVTQMTIKLYVAKATGEPGETWEDLIYAGPSAEERRKAVQKDIETRLADFGWFNNWKAAFPGKDYRSMKAQIALIAEAYHIYIETTEVVV